MCPFCKKKHPVACERRQGEMQVKNEAVKYVEEYLVCHENGENHEFLNTTTEGRNIRRANNVYREKHNLLTSYEISEIRGMYNMSQTDFARLFGWGDITVTRYESRFIQDDTYDHLIKMVREDPSFALTMLERHRNNFTEDKYERFRRVICKAVQKHGVGVLVERTLQAQYAPFNEPSDLNGGTELNMLKIRRIIAYLSRYFRDLYKVKLMKLLWYIDALSYSRRGKSVTGLIYSHMPFGALPIGSEELIRITGVNIDEVETPEGHIGYRIVSTDEVSSDGLTREEVGIISDVAFKFRDTRTRDLVKIMHQEDAYTETKQDDLIPFTLCNTLKAFPEENTKEKVTE